MPLLPILVDVCQCVCFFPISFLLVFWNTNVILVCVISLCWVGVYMSVFLPYTVVLLVCGCMRYCLYHCGQSWNTNFVGIGVCIGLYTYIGIVWMFFTCFSYLVCRVFVLIRGAVWDWCCLYLPECFLCGDVYGAAVCWRGVNSVCILLLCVVIYMVSNIGFWRSNNTSFICLSYWCAQ
jgi:hypothetical protein